MNVSMMERSVGRSFMDVQPGTTVEYELLPESGPHNGEIKVTPLHLVISSNAHVKVEIKVPARDQEMAPFVVLLPPWEPLHVFVSRLRRHAIKVTPTSAGDIYVRAIR